MPHMTNRLLYLTACLLAISLVGLGCKKTSATPKQPTKQAKARAATPPTKRRETQTPKQQVTALLKSLETGAKSPVAVVNPKKYIQHNLAVADGLAGFGAFLASVPKGSIKVKTVRVFQDGNYVFAHSEYNLFGPKIGFDVFRFENGKIVEHWDNLQKKPASTNPSGHTMTDGPTKATDLKKTKQNKALVRAFVDDILVKGKFKRLPKYIKGDHYIQHNPGIGDGLSGLSKGLKALAAKGLSIRYTKVHFLLGEGNFVLVGSEGTFGKQHTAYYDLFRVKDGKIVEHWDVIQPIPPKGKWKNTNGKF